MAAIPASRTPSDGALQQLLRVHAAQPAALVRGAASLSLLLGAKALGVQTTLALRDAVDSLKGSGAAKAGAGGFVARLAGWGASRLAQSAAQEAREALHLPVALSLRNKLLSRAYGRLLEGSRLAGTSAGADARTLQRAERALERLLPLALFQMLPTAVEVAMVSSVLHRTVGAGLAAANAATCGLYVGWTVAAAGWRTEPRKRMLRAEREASALATEGIRSSEWVRLEGELPAERRLFDNAQRRAAAAAARFQRATSVMRLGQRAIFTAGLSAMLGSVAQGVVNGRLSVGDLVMVKAFLFQLSRPVELLGSQYREMRTYLADLDALAHAASEPPAAPAPAPADQVPLPAAPADLVADRVWFRYPGQVGFAVRGASLRVRPGEVVGLAGPNGGGKTTLCRLLTRSSDPQQGTVALGGSDLRRVPHPELRSAFGAVFQGPMPVHKRRVRDLLRVGGQAAKGRESEALQAVGLRAGSDALVASLSEGQRQRALLARVLLKSPRVLVLDEATANIDGGGEEAVLSKVLTAARRSRCAVVLVAQRLETLRRWADNIAVVTDGKVSAKGTHQELLRTGGWYADTFRAQDGAVRRQCCAR